MSRMCLKVSFLPGTTLEEAIADAIEKARKLDIAFVEFSFNGVHFAISRTSDINKEIEYYLNNIKLTRKEESHEQETIPHR